MKHYNRRSKNISLGRKTFISYTQSLCLIKSSRTIAELNHTFMGSGKREDSSCLVSEHALILSGVIKAGSFGTQLLFLPSHTIDDISAHFFATHLKIPTLMCPLLGGSLALKLFFELFFVAHSLDIFL